MLIRLKTKCSCESILHDIRPEYVDQYAYVLAEKDYFTEKVTYRFAIRPETQVLRSFRRLDDTADHALISPGGVANYVEI